MAASSERTTSSSAREWVRIHVREGAWAVETKGSEHRGIIDTVCHRVLVVLRQPPADG